jgi:hypothetical protein
LSDEYQSKIIINFFGKDTVYNKSFFLMINFLVKFRNYIAHGDSSCFVSEEILYDGRDLSERQVAEAIKQIIDVKKMLNIDTTTTGYSISVSFFVKIIDGLFFAREHQHDAYETAAKILNLVTEKNHILYDIEDGFLLEDLIKNLKRIFID